MRGFPLARSFALSSFLGVALVGCATMDAGFPEEAEAGYEADESTFYRSLAPHGHWVSSVDFGWVWYPRHRTRGWRPYSVGRWAWSDQGWLWVSYEPWGWATYHYGRWFMDPFYGWVWVPGRVWAPAWVSWRDCDDYIGWAPLGPWGYGGYGRDHGHHHDRRRHDHDHDGHGNGHDRDDHDGHGNGHDRDDHDGHGNGHDRDDHDGHGNGHDRDDRDDRGDGGGRGGPGDLPGRDDRDGNVNGRDRDDRDRGGRDDDWNFTRKKDFTSSRVDRVIVDRHTLPPQAFDGSRDLPAADDSGVSRGIDKRIIERAVGRPIGAVKLEDRDTPPEGKAERAGRVLDRVPVYRPQINEKADVETPDRLGLAPAPETGKAPRPNRVPVDRPIDPGTPDREQVPVTPDREQTPGTPDREQVPVTPDREQAPGTPDREQAPGTQDREQESGTPDREQGTAGPGVSANPPKRPTDGVAPGGRPMVPEPGAPDRPTRPTTRDIDPPRTDRSGTRGGGEAVDSPSGATRAYPRTPGSPHPPQAPHVPKAPAEPHGGGSSIEPRGDAEPRGSVAPRPSGIAAPSPSRSGGYQPSPQPSGYGRSREPAQGHDGAVERGSRSQPSEGRTGTSVAPPPSRVEVGRPPSGGWSSSGSEGRGQESRPSRSHDPGPGGAPAPSGGPSMGGGGSPYGGGMSSPYGGSSMGGGRGSSSGSGGPTSGMGAPPSGGAR